MTRDENASDDQTIREEIGALLASDLATEAFPRADSQEDTLAIIARLRAPGLSLEDRLVIAGVTNHVIEHGGIEQPCETCMYYLVHRQYCELPELDCPVNPDWSCRLWRI
jgi:hypothetical protein